MRPAIGNTLVVVLYRWKNVGKEASYPSVVMEIRGPDELHAKPIRGAEEQVLSEAARKVGKVEPGVAISARRQLRNRS